MALWVATVTPTYADDEVEEFEVRVGMEYLSATTLRNVKDVSRTD